MSANILKSVVSKSIIMKDVVVFISPSTFENVGFGVAFGIWWISASLSPRLISTTSKLYLQTCTHQNTLSN